MVCSALYQALPYDMHTAGGATMTVLTAITNRLHRPLTPLPPNYLPGSTPFTLW